jgi:hypothetical protein
MVRYDSASFPSISTWVSTAIAFPRIEEQSTFIHTICVFPVTSTPCCVANNPLAVIQGILGSCLQRNRNALHVVGVTRIDKWAQRSIRNNSLV